jgi:two-component system sensor histidine kinase KdpD
MLNVVVEEVEHLKRVSANMLQLARLDSKAFSLRLEWETLEDLVGSVLHRFRSRYPSWLPTVDCDLALPMVRCDGVLLAQVIENLLDNAYRYAGPAPPSIKVWSDLERLSFAISDRGPGFDPQAQLRIFQMFERGRNSKLGSQGMGTESPERMGTGVGLALCRTILTAHGGNIIWKAREGGGSVFECWLPVSTNADIKSPDSITDQIDTP